MKHFILTLFLYIKCFDALTVADAAQWNFQHQTANLLAATAPPLQKILFLKAGTDFQNNIVLTMGGTFTELQLGFRDAAGTRGDAQGTYPVIEHSIKKIRSHF